MDIEKSARSTMSTNQLSRRRMMIEQCEKDYLEIGSTGDIRLCGTLRNNENQQKNQGEC